MDFNLWAYVFMPEHVHLIVHPRNAECDVADIRKAIHPSAARTSSLSKTSFHNGCPKSRANAEKIQSNCSVSQAEDTIETSSSPAH